MSERLDRRIGHLVLAAFFALLATDVQGGTTVGQFEPEGVPVWGDSSPWARYFRQLQDTMALGWFEEITYYDHLYVYSHGSVTARFTVTPDGTFHDPQILSNTSNQLMGYAVIRAIRKAWIQRFSAAVLARAPDGLVIEQTFRFWDYDPTEYGLASSYPQMLTDRSPEIGGAYNLDLKVFPDLTIFHFQSRILEATPVNSRLAVR